MGPERPVTSPDLSVVIPTMNKVDLLRETLAAVLGQDPGPGRTFEVIVVNDGSSDETEGYLKSLAAEDNPRVHLVPVSPGKNIGRARARNLGASKARGKWLLFLDDDIVAPPGLLASHLDLLVENPGCGTIGFAVTRPAIIDGPHFHYLDTRGVARLQPGNAPGRYFVTQNAAVPREAFQKVGGFDEGFSGYGFEDMEVAFRLEDSGVRFLALVQPIPQHVHHHTAAEYFAKKRECGQQSLPHLARLHPHRMREMNLHHVDDFPGLGETSLLSRLLRNLADSNLGLSLPRWLENWPTLHGYRPVLPRIYFALMNLAVLFSFRTGRNSSQKSAKKA